MNTTILRNLKRTKGHNRQFVTTYNDSVVSIEIQMRRGRRRIWTAQWFPCWLLACMWDVWTTETRGLHSIVRELKSERNSHYLPWDVVAALRKLPA